jgi:hypothetical protein
MVWAVRNPRAGVVEADDLDHASCLAIQRPYLGDVFGRYTDWTPITGRTEAAPSGGAPALRSPFPELQMDKSDPWQFRNVLMQLPAGHCCVGRLPWQPARRFLLSFACFVSLRCTCFTALRLSL